MATVTKKFRDDFELFAKSRVEAGEFSEADMEEMRKMIRQDLTPGPDTLRADLVFHVGHMKIPAAIDDVEERYKLWENFFADEAELIRMAA